jgi:selenocysteine lyase/cysteine desulfurase
MFDRRSLLAALGAGLLSRAAHARRPAPSPPAAEVDEDFWREVQLAFTLDRTVVNLNNGGCSPSPRVVLDALVRYLEWSNQGPPHYMWGQLEPGIEAVRRELAAEAGVDPEELAITRNASEALQIAQLGLELEPGDEVLITDQDYPRMLDTWEQRVRRDGIVLRRLELPVPPPSPEAVVEAYRAAMGPRTRVVHVSHITFLTGQIFPVRAICDLARERGVVSIVDGAHAFAQFPFRIPDLGCDYYGTSLHKWLLAPVGTGFLWIRRERIAQHWPLTPASDALRGDVRKFEEIGTHPAANHDAVAEALVFHRGIGAERKAARLRRLRRRWTEAVAGHARVRLLTLDDPAQSCGIGTVHVEGVEPGALVSHLWAKWRIIATPIVHPRFSGVRVTPNVYTTLLEVDRFGQALREVAEQGLPS